MKTCEEYVLQELEAVQGKIAELKKDKERLENSFDVLFESCCFLINPILSPRQDAPTSR